jgi:hypothetical protein
MTDLIGSLIGIILILFLCSPLALAVYILNATNIDIDEDGKHDVPYRWEKE